jgi:phenylacetate-CoA ligase
MIAGWRRVFEAAGVAAGDRVFFAFSFGPFLGFWLGFEAAARMGCLAIPGGGLRSPARLRVVIDTAATVLCCTPTYAIRLAQVAREEKIDLRETSVRTIVVGGEPGASVPGTKSHIEKLWNGARLVDHHGMTEIGPVSYGCPTRRCVLHVMESAYLAEVIDPGTREPVTPGATGELVLTNLGRLGSPLLRYRTGDLVERGPDERCACGSLDLALPGGILGRLDDMVAVRGVNVYPSAIDDILRAVEGVAEYKVEIRTGDALVEMSIQVESEPERESDLRLAQQIQQALENALALRVPVSIVAPGTLPRFEMKASRWVRL